MPRRASLPESVPLVALVGRPNVGKSTLFNRLCGGHDAIVEDRPGVTRDRRYGDADYGGVPFRVVDTGGLDFGGDERGRGLKREVQRQALRAVEEAALVLFVVDGKEGMLPADREAAQRLRRLLRNPKTLLFVANKVDGPRQELAAADFYALGAAQVFAISALHGRGLPELLESIVAIVKPALPGEAAEAPEAVAAPEGEELIRVALVGRPNAGKSSLVNRLLGDERMIVDDIPGTTRDPVDTLLSHRGHRYLLIDTAGIRRRSRVHEPTDKIAMAMAEKAVGRADVVVLVIDAAEGIGEQDARIAGLVQDAGKALVVAFNKRDLIDGAAEKKLLQDKDRKLQFLSWALTTSVSATSGKGVERLLDDVRRCHRAYTKRVGTGELNRFFEGIVERHPPPLYHGHPIRLYYITQTQVRPPTFMVSVNYPQGMHFSYERYLQNQLRETFGFVGTPLRIVAREHRNRTGRPPRSAPARGDA